MNKILYIENNEDTAEAVKILLENEGYKTSICLTGKDGINKAQNEFFDLILLDMMLTDMTGLDVLQKLRKSNVDSKCIFLSVIPLSTEQMERLSTIGMCDCITKPFKKNDLITSIRNVLE